MMKFHAPLATGLAALVVFPAMTMDSDEIRTLEEALAGTVRALEVLGGLEEQAMTNPVEAAPLIRSATETPHLPEEALDDRLNGLRREVSLLQMELDSLETPLATGSSSTASGLGLPPTVHTGLDQSLLNLMRRSMQSSVAKPPTEDRVARSIEESIPVAVKAGAQSPSIEKADYSADALGQARASYHAGRYADALVLLEGRKDKAAQYWTSRSLTRLSRFDEAITILGVIVAESGDSYDGRRAATDLEFVRWKQDFAERLPKGLKKTAKKAGDGGL